MKTTFDASKGKVPGVRIDPSLDKYDGVSLFPEKLKLANEKIKKSGFSELPKENKNR